MTPSLNELFQEEPWMVVRRTIYKKPTQTMKVLCITSSLNELFQNVIPNTITVSGKFFIYCLSYHYPWPLLEQFIVGRVDTQNPH